MIIGMIGSKGAGKDTAALALIKDGFKRVSFADPLKELARMAFGLNSELFINPEFKDVPLIKDNTTPITEKNIELLIECLNNLVGVNPKLVNDITAACVDKGSFSTPRELLQWLGTDLCREVVDKNIWLNIAKKEIAKHSNVVVTDVRFKNEADLIRELGGSTIQIFRMGESYNTPKDSHSSENDLTDHYADVTLTNSCCITQLHRKARNAVKQLIERDGGVA
jgi:hypothetical protein